LSQRLWRLVAVKLENVYACLGDDPRHFANRGIHEHAHREHGSLGRGSASGVDAGSRRYRGDLPSRWRKNEPDQVRSGGRSGCRVLRLAHAADLHHFAAGEELGQSFLVSD